MSTRRQRARKALRQKMRRRANRDESGSPQRQDQDQRVGYFAFEGLTAVCDGDGCVIAGSKKEMLRILKRMGLAGCTIQATTSAEILLGLAHGGAYCFDQQAYERFLEPARRAGLTLRSDEFEHGSSGPLGMHFVRVQCL